MPVGGEEGMIARIRDPVPQSDEGVLKALLSSE
jgi:hypothetical protein